MKSTKVISTGKLPMLKGGSSHMFGKSHAGPQKSGTTATASKTGSGGKFAKGGNGRMAGKGHVRPAKKC